MTSTSSDSCRETGETQPEIMVVLVIQFSVTVLTVPTSLLAPSALLRLIGRLGMEENPKKKEARCYLDQ